MIDFYCLFFGAPPHIVDAPVSPWAAPPRPRYTRSGKRAPLLWPLLPVLEGRAARAIPLRPLGRNNQSVFSGLRHRAVVRMGLCPAGRA